jgi:hypothetical protein
MEPGSQAGRSALRLGFIFALPRPTRIPECPRRRTPLAPSPARSACAPALAVIGSDRSCAPASPSSIRAPCRRPATTPPSWSARAPHASRSGTALPTVSLDLGQPGPDDGELQSVDILGDRLIVTRACNEYCSAGAYIIDARGHYHSPGFARTPRWGGPLNDLIAVDEDLFVAFGGFGEIAMIARGRNVATASFLPEDTHKPIQVKVQAVALDHETVAVQWCTEKMCHLTRIFLGGTDHDSKRSYLELSESPPLPRCPT